MGGGNSPGPETGGHSGANTGVATHLGAGKPGPIAAKQGIQQNLTLTGWPRSITWDEFRELTQRPTGENEDALINPVTVGGQAQPAHERGRWMLTELELEIVVNREETWVVLSQKSDALLSHEQGHFDIHGIIVGRDLIRALRGLRERSPARLRRAVRRTMQRHRRLGQRMTDDYDQNTQHGTNSTRQAAWEQQIRNAIDNNSALRGPN